MASLADDPQRVLKGDLAWRLVYCFSWASLADDPQRVLKEDVAKSLHGIAACFIG